MKRVHLWLGVGALLAFVGTGFAMTLLSPAMVARGDFERALFRSRHIYLLAGAVVNLLLGVYLSAAPVRPLQRLGSALLTASPLCALWGFLHDPKAGSLEGAAVGKYAAYTLFGGTLLHLLANVRWSRARNDESVP